jgi:uncharacterized protein (TIGR03089 family)
MDTTIPRALASAVRRDPTTPFLTWYDDASGDRTELSAATLDNWVSKTANMLINGSGLGVGDTAAVLMPPHWQTAAIVLGASAAGLAVALGGDPSPADVLFSSSDRDTTGWVAPERLVTGLLPLAMPLREVPAGSVDYVTEVRNFGDYFGGQPVSENDLALAAPVELSHLAVLRNATERAAELGVTAGDRVLIDAGVYSDVIDWLFAPLVAGASIVLCANLIPSKVESRAESEKVNVTLV